MASKRQPEVPDTPGWYRLVGSSKRRYWDGERWAEDDSAIDLPESREVFRYKRASAVENAIRSTGARLGEGIPFHELYLRRTSKKKHNW